VQSLPCELKAWLPSRTSRGFFRIGPIAKFKGHFVNYAILVPSTPRGVEEGLKYRV
jgi:hypothetical protein